MRNHTVTVNGVNYAVKSWTRWGHAFAFSTTDGDVYSVSLDAKWIPGTNEWNGFYVDDFEENGGDVTANGKIGKAL